MDIIARTVRAGYGKVPGWLPGDKYPRELSGTVGICDVTGQYYDVLLDINHNPAFEGAYNAQFGLAWYAEDGTTPIAFADEWYSRLMNGAANTDFRMNCTETNLTSGYSGMQLRTVIQGFFNAIVDPSTRLRIVPCRKLIDDGVTGQGQYNYVPEDMTVIEDKIWIPKRHEVSAATNNASSRAEQVSTQLFPMMINDATRRAYKHNALAQSASYWLCTRSTLQAGVFQRVDANGSVTSSTARTNFAIRPCYTIA